MRRSTGCSIRRDTRRRSYTPQEMLPKAGGEARGRVSIFVVTDGILDFTCSTPALLSHPSSFSPSVSVLDWGVTSFMVIGRSLQKVMCATIEWSWATFLTWRLTGLLLLPSCFPTSGCLPTRFQPFISCSTQTNIAIIPFSHQALLIFVSSASCSHHSTAPGLTEPSRGRNRARPVRSPPRHAVRGASAFDESSTQCPIDND